MSTFNARSDRRRQPAEIHCEKENDISGVSFLIDTTVVLLFVVQWCLVSQY